MKTIVWIVALNTAVALSAAPSGGVEATAAEGRLTSLGSWWAPARDFEGRWWWKESGGGSAWVRAGAVQVGPLRLSPGTEGWRHWSPSSALSSGHWGLGVDGGPWGVWAVQNPEALEAGLQARLAADAGSIAAGADRTWSLSPLFPETGAWVDRFRTGVTLNSSGSWVGLEGTSILPAAGPSGWWGKGRLLREWGPWSVQLRGAGGRDPTRPERQPWSASATVEWDLWSAGWSGQADDPDGLGSVGWRGRGWEASLAWGPRAGWEASLEAETKVMGVKVGARTTLESGDEWAVRGAFFAAGRVERGRWTGEWSAAPGRHSPVHTVTAGWQESTWEALAKWKVEGMRLGWIGPGQSFDLTVRWFF